MIDIEKLNAFIDENYIDPDSPEGKRENLTFGKNNPWTSSIPTIGIYV